MILKRGMKYQGEELYKVYINHDLGMTLTYFIYPSSQVSVYRTIGPLVYLLAHLACLVVIMSNRCKHLLGQGQTEISTCFQTSSKRFIFYPFAYFLHNVFNHVIFLAHLSRRLIGELIVYPCSGVRPSVVRPSSTISKIFFSETARPIVLILHIHHLQVGGKNNCVFVLIG